VKKKSSKRRSRAKPKKKKSIFTSRWSWLLLLSLIIIFSGYVLYLDYIIRDRFEGNRWEIPARVYASPLEIYRGAPVSKNEFLQELKRLNYRVNPRVHEEGSYQAHSDSVTVHTRSFQFWDGKEAAKKLTIQFSDTGIALIKNLQDRSAESLVRMDPVHIASIYPTQNEDRILVQLKDTPALLQESLIAVEDRKFREHAGIDYLAILRALAANLKAGKTVQGGSTLTQQLVKNYFLSSERAISRKINEAIMSILLELHYSKDDVIESYLNEVYLGQDGQRSINGFGLASQFYFGRPLKTLQPQQVALLVGMVKGPSYYDPRRHPQRAKKRRNLVLKLMAEDGLITDQSFKKYQQAPLGITKVNETAVTVYPAYLDLVKRQIRRDYKDEDLSSAGLRIFTTMNTQIQQQAEKSLSRSVTSLEKGYRLKDNSLQGAVVVTDVNNAEILAVVGDRQPRFTGFNRALDANRNIGSLVKPAVYLTALKSSQYHLSTLLNDEPITIRQKGKDTDWTPQNYDKIDHGDVPLYLALTHSYNVATVRLGLELGLDNVINTLHDLGVHRDIKPYPSLLLGAVAMSPLEVTQFYQTLANAGFYSPLRSIREVLDVKGQPLSRYPLSVSQVVNAEDSYLTKYLLHQVTSIGTASTLPLYLRQDLQVAGKTGTTDDLRDSWYAGYSQDYLSVVWLGRDDDQPAKLTGAQGAMQVWASLFNQLDARSLDMSPPSKIEMLWIDPVSGNRTDEACANAIQLPFKNNHQPNEYISCEGESDSGSDILDWLNRVF